MNLISSGKSKHIISYLIDQIKNNQNEIHNWLKNYEGSNELPLYSSVDIRDAGFKLAVVDTNIFPAGFNNLCEHGLKDSIKFMRNAILKRAQDCKEILIVAEEHTRNTWYLENVRILQQLIEAAGFRVKIATFLTVQPSFCDKTRYVELETATGFPVKIYCFKRILSEFKAGCSTIDMIIMNNDLSQGIPEALVESRIPIYPSIKAGWHSRRKSNHFDQANRLIKEFSEIINVDPWFLSCIHSAAVDVDINDEQDRHSLLDKAAELLSSISTKYKEHAIDEKPYLLLKADSGTYGMGVMPVEEPSDILNFNRKRRNKLHVGKGSLVIDRFLLQEGIPTIYNIDQEVSEACIYQIDNNLIGGFYRSHKEKGQRENLNSKGMVFKKMCPHSKKYGDCGVHHDVNIFDIYRILARISGIAAKNEIVQLEGQK